MDDFPEEYPPIRIDIDSFSHRTEEMTGPTSSTSLILSNSGLLMR